MPELLELANAAAKAARDAGGGDSEAQAARLEVIGAHRRETTGQDYAHQWQPPRQLPPERDEPEEDRVINPGRKERRGDRF